MQGYERIINDMEMSKSAGFSFNMKKKGEVIDVALDTARMMCKRIRTQFR